VLTPVSVPQTTWPLLHHLLLPGCECGTYSSGCCAKAAHKSAAVTCTAHSTQQTISKQPWTCRLAAQAFAPCKTTLGTGQQLRSALETLQATRTQQTPMRVALWTLFSAHPCPNHTNL
jgi:hypothetical protein